MSNDFPKGRCGLQEFLQIVGITKNTFFLRYRNNPAYSAMLDIKEDRRHRLHMPRAAAERIAAERTAKPVHGNKGRKPRQVCVLCGHEMHPTTKDCPTCGSTVGERDARRQDLLTEGPDRLHAATGVLPGTALRRYRRHLKSGVNG